MTRPSLTWQHFVPFARGQWEDDVCFSKTNEHRAVDKCFSKPLDLDKYKQTIINFNRS